MSAQEAIRLFSICFYVSLAIMAAGFAYAAFAFFRYRIPQVRALMTGKAQRKVLAKMRSSSQLLTGAEPEEGTEAESERKSEAEAEPETEALIPPAFSPSLSRESSGGEAGRAAKGDWDFTGVTERLDHPPEFPRQPQGKEAIKHPIGRFETIEHQMVLHTDEEL